MVFHCVCAFIGSCSCHIIDIRDYVTYNIYGHMYRIRENISRVKSFANGPYFVLPEYFRKSRANLPEVENFILGENFHQ